MSWAIKAVITGLRSLLALPRPAASSGPPCRPSATTQPPKPRPSRRVLHREPLQGLQDVLHAHDLLVQASLPGGGTGSATVSFPPCTGEAGAVSSKWSQLGADAL